MPLTALRDRLEGRAAVRAAMRAEAAVAATGDVLHISNAGPSIPEHLAQNGDLEPEIALVHCERRPGTGDQIILADHLTSALYQKP